MGLSSGAIVPLMRIVRLYTRWRSAVEALTLQQG